MKINKLQEGVGNIPEQRITDFSHVPEFHIYPPFGGYLNDVNAFFKYKDKYHLFFQYGYYANDTGLKVWMHLSSYDLVTWDYLGTPILADSPFDNKGVWSGNVFFDKDGTPVIVYYAYSYGICFAYPEDLNDIDLKKWKKSTYNPVIPMQSEKDEFVVYDASNVFLYGGKYCLLSGNKNLKTGRPTSYVFVSDDLKRWECKGEFFSPTELDGREDLACPNLTMLDEETYLFTVSSHLSGVLYYVGKIVDFKFKAVSNGRFNYHSGNEMGQSVFVDQGECVYKSWLTMRLKDELLLGRCWSGVLTLPKTLKVDKNGNLEITPHKNVFNLFESVYKTKKTLNKSEFELPFKSKSFMMKINLKHDGKSGVKFAVGDGEQTVVYVDSRHKKLVLDHSKSSKEHSLCNKYMFEFRDYEYLPIVECPLEKTLDDVGITVFFDKCVAEVFCEGKSIGKTFLPDVRSDKIILFTDSNADFGVDIYQIKRS